MEELLRGHSIVIPCYNSEKTIENLVNKLNDVMADIDSDYEIILVNDGSKDRTWNVIQKLARENDKIIGLNLMKNYGQHNALLCGIREANYEIIITLDDDLQHPPEEIPKLLKSLNEEVDVVYGSAKEQVHGLFRNISSKLVKLTLAIIMGTKIATKVSAFRVFRTKLREAFQNYNSPNVSIDVLLSWGTNKFSSVEVEHSERKKGRSNYSFLKLATHAFDMITGFSIVPIRIASITGLFFTFFGCFIMAYVLGRYMIVGGSIPGFPFLASIVTIFSGAQLFSLGVIGEYIARIHFRSMKKPAYAVKEEIKK
jgi:glycosyltransferase involved in cell wall biosynthesis